MKPLILALGMLLAAGAVQAGPGLSLHWSDCTSVQVNRLSADGPTATVLVTASGFTGPVRGHQVQIRVGRAGWEGIPDAWRFDGGGCNAGAFHAPAQGDAGCPFLIGPHPTTYSSYEFVDGMGAATFAAIYDPITPNPGATTVLARFEFDFTYGFDGLGVREGACGCLERPECIVLTLGSWLDDNHDEQWFGLDHSYLTWNDPFNTAHCPAPYDCTGDCPPIIDPCAVPTPARAKTWGGIRAQYR